jgi:predicted ABC-type ATPase
MTIVFGTKPATEPPAGDGWIWAGDHWVQVITDTGDGVPASLSLDTDDRLSVWLKFDPNQKRDKDGKWTDGPPGSGIGGVSVPTGQGTGPMTDEEFAARTKLVSESINRVRKTLATDVTHTTPAGAWTPERDAIHREIANDLYARSNHVPNDGKAVIAGGLGGAGKTTVLTKHAGVDTSQYMTVNPDDIKEELAARGLMPEVPGAAGLSPMERAMLVHEESSRIAHMLADRAYREKRNMIWDITMSSESSVKSRVAALKKAGYGEISGVFVDIPVETSVERAMARYRHGVDDWRAGKGPGGRYVPPDIIRAQKTGSGETINRKVFEEVRKDFTDSVIYDNSRNGEPPRKIG